MSSHNPLSPSSKVSREGKDNFYPKNNDEIDLIELCLGLWTGKWKVIGATLFCLGLAIFYLSITPKTYRLESTLAPPIETELRSIQLSVLEKGYGSPASVFDLVKAYFRSEDELFKFWLLYHEKESIESEETKRAFLAFYNAFSVREDIKKGTVSVTFLTTSPNEDTLLLKELHDYISKQVVNQLILRIYPNLKVQRERLESEIFRARRQYQTTLSDQIARLEEALAIAKAVGIEKTPYDQLANIELKVVDNLYMLGSVTLSSQLKVLQERDGNDAFVPELRGLQAKLERIDEDYAFLGSQKNQARAFVLLKPIARPLKPVKPKTILVLILSIVLGGMLGSFWLLIDAVIAAVNRRSKPI